MKKWIFPVLFAGVCMGTLFVNLCGASVVEESGIFSNEYLSRIQAVEFQIDGLMWYVAGTRLKEIGVLMLLMMTPFCTAALLLAVFLCGFVNSMLASTAVIVQGMSGFLLFLLILLPSGLCFYPAVFFLCERIGRTKRNFLYGYILSGILLGLVCTLIESYYFVYVIKNFCISL
jgi:hypothetical protein